jgi:hypothetical protein
MVEGLVICYAGHNNIPCTKIAVADALTITDITTGFPGAALAAQHNQFFHSQGSYSVDLVFYLIIKFEKLVPPFGHDVYDPLTL